MRVLGKLLAVVIVLAAAVAAVRAVMPRSLEMQGKLQGTYASDSGDARISIDGANAIWCPSGEFNEFALSTRVVFSPVGNSILGTTDGVYASVRSVDSSEGVALVRRGETYRKTSSTPVSRKCINCDRPATRTLDSSIRNSGSERVCDVCYPLYVKQGRCTSCGRLATQAAEGVILCDRHYAVVPGRPVAPSSSSSYGSGSLTEWEVNGRSATRKLLQGRTDLTQDEVDAYRQSEAQYDATH